MYCIKNKKPPRLKEVKEDARICVFKPFFFSFKLISKSLCNQAT